MDKQTLSYWTTRSDFFVFLFKGIFLTDTVVFTEKGII